MSVDLPPAIMQQNARKLHEEQQHTNFEQRYLMKLPGASLFASGSFYRLCYKCKIHQKATFTLCSSKNWLRSERDPSDRI